MRSFEKKILSKISKFTALACSSSTLNQKQSGIRSGHSTESALLHMTDTWLQAINDGNIVGCVDFRKAFDLIDYK